MSQAATPRRSPPIAPVRGGRGADVDLDAVLLGEGQRVEGGHVACLGAGVLDLEGQCLAPRRVPGGRARSPPSSSVRRVQGEPGRCRAGRTRSRTMRPGATAGRIVRPDIRPVADQRRGAGDQGLRRRVRQVRHQEGRRIGCAARRGWRCRLAGPGCPATVRASAPGRSVTGPGQVVGDGEAPGSRGTPRGGRPSAAHRQHRVLLTAPNPPRRGRARVEAGAPPARGRGRGRGRRGACAAFARACVDSRSATSRQASTHPPSRSTTSRSSDTVPASVSSDRS